MAAYTAFNRMSYTNGNWERWMDGISFEGRFGNSNYYGDSSSPTHTAYSTQYGDAWVTVFCSEVDYTDYNGGNGNRYQQDDWGSCEIPFEDSSGTVYNTCTTVGWSQPWCGVFHEWWTGSLTGQVNLEDCAAATDNGVYNWVDSDLSSYAASSSSFNVILTHRPMYCSTIMWCPYSDNLVDDIEPLMASAGTDFMVAGHTHSYERTGGVDDWVSSSGSTFHVAVSPTVNPYGTYNNNVDMQNPTGWANSCPAFGWHDTSFGGWDTGYWYGWQCSGWNGPNWMAQVAGGTTFDLNSSGGSMNSYDYQTGGGGNSQACGNSGTSCPPSSGVHDTYSW
jgi:hypothetical protein